MNSFLVRTLDNRILGPFTKEQVSEQILKGTLKARDEIAQANDYWFYVQEREETLKRLGIEMPIHRDPDDDVTVTETVTATNPAEVLKAAAAPPPIEGAAPIPADKVITDLNPSPLEALTATERPSLDEPQVRIEFPFYFILSVWTVLAILVWMGFQIYRELYPDYSYPAASQIAPGLTASPTSFSHPAASSTPSSEPRESP